MSARAKCSRVFRTGAVLAVGLSVVLVGTSLSGAVESASANGTYYGATDDPDDMVLPESSHALNDGEPLAEALRVLQNDRYSSIFNHTWADDSTGEVSIHYDGTADPGQVQMFLAEVEGLPKISGVTVSTSAMDYSRQASQAVVEEMFDEREYWAEVFGSPMYGLGVDSETGEVRIALSKEAIDESKNVLTEKNGVPIVFEVFPDTDEAEIGPQVLSRTTDANPWTGGSRLSLTAGNNTLHCTAGFVWIRNSKLHGSTAAHCTQGSNTKMYNNGALYGTLSTSNPARDFALLAPAAGKTYLRYAWNGDKNALHRAPVTHTRVPQSNDLIALSSAGTNRFTGNVIAWDHAVPAHNIGPYLTVMNTNECGFGDSGGTWIRSWAGTGNLIAVGQHRGLWPYNSVNRCMFIPVHHNSGNQSVALSH